MIFYMEDLVIEFTKSAFRHKISVEDIRHVVRTRRRDSVIPALAEKHAIIGFDRALNELEIMYNQIDDDTIQVFHAMPLRSGFAKKYGL
jgi:hypothetical protein